MSSAETGQMSAVETGQMSAAETYVVPLTDKLSDVVAAQDHLKRSNIA